MFAQGTLVTRAKLVPALDPTPSLVSVYNWLYEWLVTQKTPGLEPWREHAKATLENRHAKVMRQRACDKTQQRTLCPTLDNQESSRVLASLLHAPFPAAPRTTAPELRAVRLNSCLAIIRVQVDV